MPEEQMMRIQKKLSELGVASRRQAEQWLAQGRIEVNGRVVTELGTKVGPLDRIAVDHKPVVVAAPPKVYWMLNKPKKILCSHGSSDEKPTIFDLPVLRQLSFKINCVGRLDYLTEGLLLVTNDGDMIYGLTHPKFHLPRRYQVLVPGKLSLDQINQLKKGVSLPDGVVKDVEIALLGHEAYHGNQASWYYITVYEGRNRLVRRLFEFFDKPVLRLVRYGFGSVQLPSDLRPGSYRQLTSQQVRDLKGSYN